MASGAGDFLLTFHSPLTLQSYSSKYSAAVMLGLSVVMENAKQTVMAVI